MIAMETAVAPEEWLLFVMVTVCATMATLFPMTYALTAPWYKTMTGRIVLLHLTALAFLLDIIWVISASEVMGRPLPYWLGVVIIGLGLGSVLGSILTLFYSLWRIHRSVPKSANPTESVPTTVATAPTPRDPS